ncbi:MAG: hypothetical protein AAF862_05880 [Pseudomonadota bacterium]
MLRVFKSRRVFGLLVPIVATLMAASAQAALIRYTVSNSIVYSGVSNAAPGIRTDILDGASLSGSFLYDSITQQLSGFSLRLSGVTSALDGMYATEFVSSRFTAFLLNDATAIAIGGGALNLGFAPRLPVGPAPALEDVSLASNPFFGRPDEFTYSTVETIETLFQGSINSTQLAFQLSGTLTPTLVPLPAAAPLFGAALLGVAALRKQRRS